YRPGFGDEVDGVAAVKRLDDHSLAAGDLTEPGGAFAAHGQADGVGQRFDERCRMGKRFDVGVQAVAVVDGVAGGVGGEVAYGPFGAAGFLVRRRVIQVHERAGWPGSCPVAFEYLARVVAGRAPTVAFDEAGPVAAWFAGRRHPRRGRLDDRDGARLPPWRGG